MVIFHLQQLHNDSFNVKVSDSLKQNLFLGIFFSKPFAFLLATKVNPSQIQKYFGFGLLETRTKTSILRPQAKFPRKFDPP
jgi:hypothetical protein